MQYGYSDDAAREYMITRPDIPQSWSNYLGSTEYGAIFTNYCGGKRIYVEVRIPASACKGVQKIVLNGAIVAGNVIPAELLKEEDRAEVIMGQYRRFA